MSGPDDGPQSMDFVDNTGATVTAIVVDPAVARALNDPSIADRPPAPVAQLFGPPQMEPADWQPFD